MPKCSSSRISIINLIQAAYDDLDKLNIDILNYRLDKLAHREHPRLIVDINYYMLCLRMEMQQFLRTM